MDKLTAARLRNAMEAQVRDRVREGVRGYRKQVAELRAENARLRRELEDMREQRDTAIEFAQNKRV